MIKPTNQITIQRICNVATAGLFAIVIALPLMDWAFNLDPTPRLVENRKLTRKPALSIASPSIFKYPDAYDKYFNDHFGFRNMLVRLYGMERVALTGSSWNGRVIIGKDGWLYVNAGGGLLDEYRSVAPFTDDELVKYQIALEERAEMLAKHGVKYIFFVAPDSYSIYPEYLPDKVNRVNERMRVDQIVEHLKRQTDLTVVDLREPMLKAKSSGRLYHKTDTHWNDLGAYVAYAQVQEEVARQFPAAGMPLPLSDFDCSKSLQEGMDLTRILGLQDKFREEVIQLVPHHQRRAVQSSKKPAQSKYARTNNIPFAMEVADPKLPRAIMLRDSFANAMVPLMSEHYSRIAYYWQVLLDEAVIEREKPNLVIQEIVGRIASEKVQSNPGKVATPRLNMLRKYVFGAAAIPSAILNAPAPANPTARGPVAALSYPPIQNGSIEARKGRDLYAFGWVTTNADPKITVRVNGNDLPLRYEARTDVAAKFAQYRYHVGWVARVPGSLLNAGTELQIAVGGQVLHTIPVHVADPSVKQLAKK